MKNWLTWHRHEASPVIIKARRWDPVTGTTSAVIGTGADLARATSDMVFKPYQEFTRSSTSSSRPSVSGSSSSSTTNASRTNSQDLASLEEPHPTGIKDEDLRFDWENTAAAVTTSAKGVGRFIGSYYKGVIVDIPLATTEGLRAVPRLYGEDVEDYVVRDWKTGAAVGGKNFAHGMTKGLTGFFTEPIKGGAKEGPMGLVKGFAKGTLGIATKMPSGKKLLNRFSVNKSVLMFVFCSCIGPRHLPSSRYH